MYNAIYIGSSWRAPTQKQAESQLTILCKLAGPNIEAGGKSANNIVQVGG
ncbi:hypothetical protein EF901_08705, partial [Staphylococcus aureus]